jgi:hypothetical protein
MDKNQNLFEEIQRLKDQVNHIRGRLEGVVGAFTNVNTLAFPAVGSSGGPTPPTLWGEIEHVTNALGTISTYTDLLTTFVGAENFAKNAAYHNQGTRAGGIRG